MSAWLCSAEHISAVAEMCKLYIDDNIEPEKLFKLLVRENIKSLACRYGNIESDKARAKTYCYIPQLVANRSQDNVEFYKTLACYDYQTCEHEGYAKGKIGKLIAEAMDNAAKAHIYCTKRWDEAPWGWKGY